MAQPICGFAATHLQTHSHFTFSISVVSMTVVNGDQRTNDSLKNDVFIFLWPPNNQNRAEEKDAMNLQSPKPYEMQWLRIFERIYGVSLTY